MIINLWRRGKRFIELMKFDEHQRIYTETDYDFRPYLLTPPGKDVILKTFKGDTLRLRKVFAESSWEIPELKTQYKPCYEADIPYETRYIIDKDIRLFDWDFDNVEESVENIMKTFRKMKVVAVDLEWDNEGQIFAFSYANDEKIDAVVNVEAIHSRAERKKLIMKLIDVLDDADVIITYGGWQFDIPKLRYNMEELKIHGYLNYDEYGIFRMFSDESRNYYWTTKFAYCIDFLPLIKNKVITIKSFTNYGLATVVNELFGYEMKLHELKMERDKLAELDKILLIKYAREDAKMTWLFKSMIPAVFFTSAFTMTPLERLTSKMSLRVEPVIMKEIRRNGYVIPERRTVSYEQYYGAIVIKPRPFIGNVMKADFRSMYPTIVSNFNISPETINCGHENCPVIGVPLKNGKTKKIQICKLKRGFYAEFVKRLIEVSETIKKMKKRNSVYADAYASMKAIRNTIAYGYAVAPRNRLGNPAIAPLITYVGRQVLKKGIKIIEPKFDFSRMESQGRIIYGHTDSFFFSYNDLNEAIDKIRRIEESTQMHLDAEPGILYIGERKNRYLFVSEDGIEAIGFNFKRKDSMKILQYVFNDFYQKLGSARTVDRLKRLIYDLKYKFTKIIEMIEKDELPLEAYVVSRTLNLYAIPNTPQKKAYKILCDEGMDDLIDGDKISYIYVLLPPYRRKDATAFPYDEDLMKKYKAIIDKRKYKKLVEKAMKDVIFI